MIGLQCGEETVTICQAVYIEYRYVTYGQTDRRMDTRTSHDGIGRVYAEHISWQKLAFFDQYLALIPKTLQDTVIVTHMEDE